MLFKKMFFLLPAVLMFFFFANSSKAETLSISAGLPISYAFNDSDIESDGISGTLLHVKLPILVGLGLETYSVKLKDVSGGKFDVTMLDVFYLFPIPIVNITLGAGIGSSAVVCDAVGTTATCSDRYEPGMPTQIYGQFGFPIFGPLDLHVSYHSISSTLKGKTESGNTWKDLDMGGKMLAIGTAFTF